MPCRHTHGPGPCPVISAEASSCSRWEQIETHSQTPCRESETLGYSALNRMSPSDPSLQGSGNSVEDEVKRIGELERMEDPKKVRPSKSTWAKVRWIQRDWGSTHRACMDLHQFFCVYSPMPYVYENQIGLILISYWSTFGPSKDNQIYHTLKKESMCQNGKFI